MFSNLLTFLLALALRLAFEGCDNPLHSFWVPFLLFISPEELISLPTQKFGVTLKGLHNYISLCSMELSMIGRAINALGTKSDYVLAATIPITTGKCYGSLAYFLHIYWFGWNRPLWEGRGRSNCQSPKWNLLRSTKQLASRIPIDGVGLMTYPHFVCSRKMPIRKSCSMTE